MTQVRRRTHTRAAEGNAARASGCLRNPPYRAEPAGLLRKMRSASAADVDAALLGRTEPGQTLAALLSATASKRLEDLADAARNLTERNFGRTISLYTPLYISNHCHGGCAYCGFASDRPGERTRLSPEEIEAECAAIRKSGIDDVLLLTGERTPAAGFEYVRKAVSTARRHFNSVSVEAFAMSEEEYAALADAGCDGVTLYQETYDRSAYERLHRWGEKADYDARLLAPSRALAAGIRSIGLGALLGLSDWRSDAICLFQHAAYLRKTFWRSGILISFPRLRPEAGGFAPADPVDDRTLAQIIFAFRICMPDVQLVLSTRESPSFRDGMAGLATNRMSIASRTTVGGYAGAPTAPARQFEVNDDRSIQDFRRAIRKKHLEPVFKNWDSVFSD